MLKRFFFAVAPLMLIAGSVTADDDLLSSIAKLEAGNDAVATVADADVDELGQADVDALMGDDDASEEDAIAACFRRISYGYGYGYHNYYRSYSYSHYTPVYRSYHHCYTPTYHYRPVTYSYYTPCYTSYWGW